VSAIDIWLDQFKVENENLFFYDDFFVAYKLI